MKRLNEFGIEDSWDSERNELRAIKFGKLFFENSDTNDYVDRGGYWLDDERGGGRSWIDTKPSYDPNAGKSMLQLWGETWGTPDDYNEFYMDDLAAATQGMNTQQIVDFAKQNHINPAQFRYHSEQFPQFAGVSEGLAQQGIYGGDEQFDFNAKNAKERANKSSNPLKAGFQALGSVAPALVKYGSLGSLGAGFAGAAGLWGGATAAGGTGAAGSTGAMSASGAIPAAVSGGTGAASMGSAAALTPAAGAYGLGGLGGTAATTGALGAGTAAGLGTAGSAAATAGGAGAMGGVMDFLGSPGGGAITGAVLGGLLNDGYGGQESSTSSTSQAPSYLMPYLTDQQKGIYPLSQRTYENNMNQGYLGRNEAQQGLDAQTIGQMGQWNNNGFWQDAMNNSQNFSDLYGTNLNPVANTAAPGTIDGFSVDSNAARQGMGSLDPTGALAQALSGQIDTRGLDASQQAVTNRAMLGYGDAVSDAGDMYERQIAPQIRSNAILDGGYGGSRQGIAEGIAAGDLNKQLSRNSRDLGLASMDVGTQLYGNAYNQAQSQQYGAGMGLNDQAVNTSQNNANRAYGAAGQNVGNQMGNQQFNANLGLQNNTQLGQMNQQNANIAGQGQGLYAGNMNNYLQSQQQLGGLMGLGTQDQRNQQNFDWQQLNNYISSIQGDRGMTTNSNSEQPGNLMSSIGYGMDIGQGLGSYFQGNPSTAQAYQPYQANNQAMTYNNQSNGSLWRP